MDRYRDVARQWQGGASATPYSTRDKFFFILMVWGLFVPGRFVSGRFVPGRFVPLS